MKKFLIKLLLYVVLLLTFTLVIARFDNADRNSNPDHNVLKIGHMSAFDSLNILFLGNSYCYSSIYSPLFDSLNRKTFNLGVATSGPRFYELLMQDYLNSVKKKPDTVMLLLSPTTFSTQADDWKDYPIHRYLQRPLSNEEVTREFGTFTQYPAMVFNSVRKGLNNLVSRNKQTPGKELKNIYAYKGLFVDSTITSDSLEKAISNLFLPLRKDHFDYEGAKLMTSLAGKLKQQGMEVMFFETPTFHLNHYFSQDFLRDYEQYCSTLAAQYPVLRNKLALDERYFRNIDHTNTQGAYQFTHYLINRLNSHQYTDKISRK